MTADSFQPGPYGSEQGPYGGEYGYDVQDPYLGAGPAGYGPAPGQYPAGQYAPGPYQGPGPYAGPGQYGGGYAEPATGPASAEYRYDPPTADHRLYGQRADSGAGGYGDGGYSDGGYGDGGYGDGGYRTGGYSAPAAAQPGYGGYPDGYGSGPERYQDRYRSDTPGYDDLADRYPGGSRPAAPPPAGQYTTQYSGDAYRQAAATATATPPGGVPTAPGYTPPAGYTNGEAYGYSANQAAQAGPVYPAPVQADPRRPASFQGHQNGQQAPAGYLAPGYPPPGYPNGQPGPGYANGQATGYAAAYTEAPAPPARPGYDTPVPNPYAIQPGVGTRRPGARPRRDAPVPNPYAIQPGVGTRGPGAPPPTDAPADWYRPTSRPAEATNLLRPLDDEDDEDDDGELTTVEGEVLSRGQDRARGGTAVARRPSTEIARPQDVIPSVEIAVKNRRGSRKESRISEDMQRRLVILVALAGAVATMVMWWYGSYEGSLDSYENLAAGVAQVAGLMAEYLLLIQVLLMARIPLLERAIGTEHLTRAHVILGFSVMAFVVEHIVGAIILNSPPGVSPVNGLVGVVFGLRDVLTAAVGTALLFGVVYLSTKRVRQRIPYEVWRYLHLFVYLGIGLEFIHQLTLGVHFLNSQVALYYWLAIHAVTFGLVAWYRFGVIIRMNLRHRLQVDRVVQEGPGVYSIYFTGNRLDKFEGSAGQFCRWRFMNREGWWQSHPFSLSAAPTSQYLRITVKQLGDWTKMHLPDLETGTPVIFSGPYGGLTPARRKRRKVLLVAAGIGITPMRSLLAGLPADPGDITLLYRASSEKDLVFQAELDELARQRGATVHYLVGPRDQFPGGDPLGAESLKSLIPGVHRHDVYLCGPDGMLSAAVKGLRGARVPRRQIHTERFAF